jgi:hypothetical protein
MLIQTKQLEIKVSTLAQMKFKIQTILMDHTVICNKIPPSIRQNSQKLLIKKEVFLGFMEEIKIITL